MVASINSSKVSLFDSKRATLAMPSESSLTLMLTRVPVGVRYAIAYRRLDTIMFLSNQVLLGRYSVPLMEHFYRDLASG